MNEYRISARKSGAIIRGKITEVQIRGGGL
jgi:hypothetical protein